MLVVIAVLMIRVENCPDICFPIVNSVSSPLIMCLVKFGLTGQMLNLTRNCMMSGHYRKFCNW